MKKHKRKIIGHLTWPAWNESYIPLEITELRRVLISYRTGYFRVTLIGGLKEKKLLPYLERSWSHIEKTSLAVTQS